MTALTQDRNTPLMGIELLPVSVAAGVVIYAGALVVADAEGFAAPGKTATGLTYLGRAEEAVNNTGGADGAKTVMVRRNKAFLWENHTNDPVTQASIGKHCYIVDDQTVAAGAGDGTRSQGGIVLRVADEGVWVE
jgi:hypothetical protein